MPVGCNTVKKSTSISESLKAKLGTKAQESGKKVVKVDIPFHKNRKGRPVRFVVVSDTHNGHHEAQMPEEGDVLLHCGDFTNKHDWKSEAYKTSLGNFNRWLGEQPYPIRIVIAGNHEVGFNKLSAEQIHKQYLSNATHYLQDSSCVVHGLRVHGSPWTRSRNMGFSASKEEITEKWKLIHRDTDLLMTHLPPYLLHDLAWVGNTGEKEACSQCGIKHPTYRHWGERSLRKEVESRLSRVRVHCYGHVHDAPGSTQLGKVTFINASFDLKQKVYTFEMNAGKEEEGEDKEKKKKKEKKKGNKKKEDTH